MTVTGSMTSLTAELADRVARQAAAVVGLAHDRTELVRVGETAILRLPKGVVARVSRGPGWAEVAEREVRVAAALETAGVPCVQPVSAVDQPVTVEGYPVTFWVEIPGPLGTPNIAELGAALRRLHTAEVELEVPVLDPWYRITDRVGQVPISDAQRQVLTQVLAEVQDAWANARFELGVGVIHGDAHLGNLVRGADGSTALGDLETVCTGPREWDLVPTGLYATTLGWITPAQYQTFVDAYGGYDVTTSPAFPLLRRIRELRMTSWIAQHARESERMAAEVDHRIACLADPDLPRRWSAR